MINLLIRDVRLAHGDEWAEAILYIVNTFQRRKWRDLEDKLQEALADTLVKWSPTGGASKKTMLLHAFFWANSRQKDKFRRIKRGADRSMGNEAETLSLNASIMNNDEGEETELQELIADEKFGNPADILIDKDLQETVFKYINELNIKERIVIELMYGLDGGKSRLLEEVGAVLDLTKEAVRLIKVKALRKLAFKARNLK